MFVALFLQSRGDVEHWASCAVFGLHLDKWTRPKEGVFRLIKDMNYDEIVGGYPTGLTLDRREHRLFYTDHLSGLYMVDVDSVLVFDPQALSTPMTPRRFAPVIPGSPARLRLADRRNLSLILKGEVCIGSMTTLTRPRTRK